MLIELRLVIRGILASFRISRVGVFQKKALRKNCDPKKGISEQLRPQFLISKNFKNLINYILPEYNFIIYSFPRKACFKATFTAKFFEF